MSPAVARILGSGLGLGRIPLAPGTWGSFGTIAVFNAVFGVAGQFDGLLPLHGRDPALLMGAVVLVIVVLFWIGRALGDRAERDWGRVDPGPFVLDEVVGQLIALIPLAGAPAEPLMLLVAFMGFRFCDILKPPPCRRLEALPGGLGIMADDVAAGLIALVPVLVLAT
jgi:phosphatidylglycerophosphatase A